MNWADSNQVSYLAWTWDTWGCVGSGPVLISNYDGTACVPFGSTYQQHLATLIPNIGTPHFTVLPGGATDISVGANGTAWIIGATPANGNYPIYQWNGTTWAAVPGAAVTVAVGPDGTPWVINASHHIYHRVGTTWIQAPGGATDISVGGPGSGTAWVIGATPTNGNYPIYQWTGTTWAAVPGAAVKIAVGPDGSPWVINASHHIYHRVGTTWIQAPGGATDISVGGPASGTAWVIGATPTNGNYPIYRWTGTTWAAVPGAAVKIAVGPNGDPWVINASHHIYTS